MKDHSLNEYLQSFSNGQHLLLLERAADEYIQAEQELMIESTTTVDNFIDGFIDNELSEEELDNLIDGIEEVDLQEENDDFYPNDFVDDPEMSDVDTILDLEPEVNELDIEEEEL